MMLNTVMKLYFIVFQTQYSLKLKKLKLKLKCFVEITDSEDAGVCS